MSETLLHEGESTQAEDQVINSQLAEEQVDGNSVENATENAVEPAEIQPEL